MKQKVLTFASLMKNFLGALLLLALCSLAVFAYPQVGHQFYGYAGSGSSVTVIVRDLTYTTSVDIDGYYGYDPLFFIDAASDDSTGAEEWDTLTFYLDGIAVTTSTFEIGGVTKLNLADETGATTSGTSSSTDTGTTTGTDTSDYDDDDDDFVDDDESQVSSDDTEEEECTHAWKCTNWSTCAENGFQTRTCYYVGDCTSEGNQSDTRQRCTYVAHEKEQIVEADEASCYDNVQNQGERGVDCGGPCDACATTIHSPAENEPKTNWLYMGFGLFLILFIIAVILAHKYKDKLSPYLQRFKSKIEIKPEVKATSAKPFLGMQQRSAYSQQYQPYMYRK